MMTKVAFVGCGGIMGVHAERLRQIDGVQCVGHCDIIRERAADAAARYGGKAFTDAAAMFSEVSPDAAYICVPPYAHGDIEEAAAAQGVHLFIEKPVALDMATARRVAAAVRDAGITVSVGYHMRYGEAAAEARRALRGKAPCLVNGRWIGGMPGAWWWRQMDRSGGQIVEQSTHLFDLMRYTCGEVAEVYAVACTGCMNHIKDFDVHDSSVVTMRLKTGGTASITSCCVAEHVGRIDLAITSPETTVMLEPACIRITEGLQSTERKGAADMYLEEDRAFIDAVQSGRKNRIRSSYADAMKTLAVTCAANESILTGLPVKP